MERDTEISMTCASGRHRGAGAGAGAGVGVGAGAGSGEVRRRGIKVSRNSSEGQATGGLPYKQLTLESPQWKAH